MSKIKSIKMIPEDNLSKYEHILYGLNFMQEILEQEPGNCILTDDTEMWHLQIDESKLKESLFYNYGYILENTDEKLWKVLEGIDKNIKEHIPDNLYAFWAIPNRLCFSHSHPSKDVFRIEKMARNIVEKQFDLIIELRSRNQEDINKKNYLFDDIAEEFNSDVMKCSYVIPDRDVFGIIEIQRIISKIDRYLAKGKKVLFHSQGRTERLALVLASWLFKHKLANENNFIYKIALLRLGFSINNIDDDPQKQWEHNRFFETNCDRTRTFQIIKGKTFFVKHRQMQFVPFYFTKAKNEELNYWTREFMKVDYDVDPEALEIIRHFGMKTVKVKSKQGLSDERY